MLDVVLLNGENTENVIETIKKVDKRVRIDAKELLTFVNSPYLCGYVAVKDNMLRIHKFPITEEDQSQGWANIDLKECYDIYAI